MLFMELVSYAISPIVTGVYVTGIHRYRVSDDTRVIFCNKGTDNLPPSARGARMTAPRAPRRLRTSPGQVLQEGPA